MQVEIVSPDEVLWEGQAGSVIAPAQDGDLGILPGRQPVLAALRPGTVRITPADGGRVSVDVQAGFLSVDDDHVQIVVDHTVERDHIMHA